MVNTGTIRTPRAALSLGGLTSDHGMANVLRYMVVVLLLMLSILLLLPLILAQSTLQLRALPRLAVLRFQDLAALSAHKPTCSAPVFIIALRPLQTFNGVPKFSIGRYPLV